MFVLFFISSRSALQFSISAHLFTFVIIAQYHLFLLQFILTRELFINILDQIPFFYRFLSFQLLDCNNLNNLFEGLGIVFKRLHIFHLNYFFQTKDFILLLSFFLNSLSIILPILVINYYTHSLHQKCSIIHYRFF